MKEFSRRQFLQGLGATAAIGLLPSGLGFRMAYAQTPGDKRLLVVILRGAMDGLGAVIPYADSSYAAARAGMAMDADKGGMIALDRFFAVHKALTPFAELYKQKQLLVLHASATPYRDRSHFDAQDLLENGGSKPHELNTGWLNRAVAALPQKPEALAVGPTIPLVLRGSAGVNAWSPSTVPEADVDYLSRVMAMYESDAALKETLGRAEQMRSVAGMQENAKRARAFPAMIEKAASFMVQPAGPRIAAIDIGGWDTHSNQGLEKGRLANALTELATGIEAYRKAMGAAWKDTAVLVLTEFGRTVKANGTGGTDHGTASVAFLLGGAVNGGRMLGDWPGLAKLFQDRDLIPANDVRALIKSTLQQHLGISQQVLDTSVFPGSGGIYLNDQLVMTKAA